MSSRRLALGSWLPLVSLLATPAAAEDPFRLRPGATGAVCVECHETFRETLEAPHVHSPVAAGECTDCHDPHASEHGMLLAEETDRICFECHADIVPDSALSSHAAVVEGDCVGCHDPHASANPNALNVPAAELCASCHAEVAGAAAGAKFKHPPVADCLGCHDPHASSTSLSLLVDPPPQLCVECHDPSRSAFRERHQGYPVEQGRCTSCHDPHGSNTGAMLWDNVHRPVANRMCDQCHEDATSSTALRTKRQGFELCRACHTKTLNEIMARERIHWPVVDRNSCLNCHNPHASPNTALLTDAEKPLCGTCHADALRRHEQSVTKHQPIEDGSCTVCHGPHSADGVFLLQEADTIEFCAGCHDWQSHSTHPIGVEVVDRRNPNLTMDCLSCHRTHGTEHEHLSHFAPTSELCVACHEKFGN